MEAEEEEKEKENEEGKVKVKEAEDVEEKKKRRRLRNRASLIFLRVFSEEMVGWRLRSSDPCGCTLTLRDRFLWLSVLVRVGAERWGQREREREEGGGGYLGQGAEGR